LLGHLTTPLPTAAPAHAAPMLYFIAYDIPCDRRRRRVARLLEGHGWRLHESAYTARLRDGAFRALHERLARLLHPQDDRLRVYPLCQRDTPDRVHVVGPKAEDPPAHHVL
jgi:CRISPR-associated protein Cas2